MITAPRAPEAPKSITDPQPNLSIAKGRPDKAYDNIN